MNSKEWREKVEDLFIKGSSLEDIARLFPPPAFGRYSGRRFVTMALMGRDAILKHYMEVMEEEGIDAETSKKEAAEVIFSDRYPDLHRIAELSDLIFWYEETARIAEKEALKYRPPLEWAEGRQVHEKCLAEARRLRREAEKFMEERSVLAWKLRKRFPASPGGDVPTHWLEVDTRGLLRIVGVEWHAAAPIWSDEDRRRIMDEVLAMLRDAPPREQEGAMIMLANSLGKTLHIE